MWSVIFLGIICLAHSSQGSTCAKDLFTCGKHSKAHCIAKTMVCDGKKDCPDGSDEKANCVRPTCEENEYPCADLRTCIPSGWLCDGDNDCKDGSDELAELCLGDEDFECPPNKYLCDGTHQCIWIDRLCDGVSDCPDSEDEGQHCRSDHCANIPCSAAGSCRPTLQGALCWCGRFAFYNSTTNSCQDINECLDISSCDQHCEDLAPGFSCSCGSGYELDGNTSCRALNVPHGEPALLLFSNGTVIQMISIDGTADSTGRTLWTAEAAAETLDYDLQQETFCYVSGSALRCSGLNSDHSSSQIQTMFTVDSVGDMAFEWLAGNWYFTDTLRESVFVCRRNGSVCITLLSVNVSIPEAIGVDPTAGLMFFTTLGDKPRVLRAALDGSALTTLVQHKHIVRPDALTMDYANRRVYWADSYLHQLESISYEGTGRMFVTKAHPTEAVLGLSMLENDLYAAQQVHGIVAVNRFHQHANNRTILQFDFSSRASVKVVHDVRQLEVPGGRACHAKACRDVCVTMFDASKTSSTNAQVYLAKCLCRAGLKPDPSNPTQCIQALEEKFLVYANAKLGEIKGISLNGSNSAEVLVPILGLQHPVAVDFHRGELNLYYSQTNSSKSSIGRRKVHGSDRQDDFITEGIVSCEGIAIDWIGNNIFWTDEGLKTISVARLENVTIRRTLVSLLSHPRAIVVDPRQSKGLMYWTDWHPRPGVGLANGRNRPSVGAAKIMSSYMDGSNVAPLVTADIQWPNGLSIDYTTDLLYWSDAYLNRICSVSLTGNHTTAVIATSEHLVNKPYGLVHFHDLSALHFYWTEFTDGLIKHLQVNTNMTALGKADLIRHDSVPIFEIRLFDNASQTVSGNPCAEEPQHNGGCEHLCLLAGTRVVCACADGHILKADNTSCQRSSEPVEKRACSSEMEWQCPRTGKCINRDWQCDGDNDCGDNSDEDPLGICANFECPNPEKMYKCSNNRCIYTRWKCDGEDDCRTGEDEAPDICHNTTCAANMTQCPQTFRCIPQSWRCDHDNDCGDGSDEANCTHVSCLPHQFTCQNQRCINLEYVCDEDDDCRDGSDEANCAPANVANCTAPSYFRCDDGQCVDGLLKCDGEPNCRDRSDEEDCVGRQDLCSPDDQFQCLSGLCLPKSMRCDGNDDCIDGSDETMCNQTVQCLDTEFRCLDDQRCISKELLCDGDFNCTDKSDEDGCQPACELPARLCGKQKSVCVQVEQLCDNRQDCDDGSDEGGLCYMDQCISNDCQYKCHPSPKGYQCMCPPGKKLLPNNTCTDAKPCSRWGVCGQRCSEYSNSYRCECLPGFHLELDRFTCRPDDDMYRYIIFSNRHEIRRLDIESQTYVSLVSGLRNTIALDFYYNHSGHGEGSLVFWTDVADDKIYKGTLISNFSALTNVAKVVNVGLSTAEGLAVDWVTQHLYWVESNLDQIEVANFDGTHRTTLVAGNMDSPRAIAVDPRVGVLFWSDWHTQQPRIEKCSMDGKNRRVIFNVTRVVGGGWPNGLTIDYEAYRLYWIDAKSDSIHCVKYDGSDHREVIRGHQFHEFLAHPFAISVFGNYVYWTDWRTNSLVRANKWNGTDLQVIQRTLTQPFDLHVFHPQRQPIYQVRNPCLNNGVCDASAICLLSYNNTSGCRCPHLKKLRADKKSCEDDGIFLLFAKKQELRGVDLENSYNVIPALTVPYVYNPMAVDFDSKSRKIYWTDDDLKHGKLGIHSANLNGTDIETIINSDIDNPQGFALDWLSGNMYFSSYSSNDASISVAQLNGAYRTVLLKPGQHGLRLQQPNSLVVHPTRGKLYWSDEGGIFSANLDGTSFNRLYPRVHSGIYDVETSSLSIDFERSKLWWLMENTTDHKTTVMSSELNGTGAAAFLPDRPYLAAVTAITVHAGRLYFAQGASEARLASVKLDGSGYTVLRNTTPGVQALRMFTHTRVTAEDAGMNACAVNNGGCAQLCLPHGPGTKVCTCTAGYKPNDNTCQAWSPLLIYSTTKAILGMSLVNESGSALPPISKISSADAIDFDAAKNYIYWVDSSERTISRIKRDLTGRETLIKDRIIGVEGLAVDWIADNIYWTDSGLDVIEVARSDGSHRYVVVHDLMDKPKGIVVDPVEGYLYWADWGIDPKIERARLDGTEREVLIGNHTAIQMPYALVLDYSGPSRVLYWCDKQLDTIERVQLDTMTRTVIVHSVSDCKGLSLDDQHVYWTDIAMHQGSIQRAFKNGSQVPMPIYDAAHNMGNRLGDVKVFSQDRQKGTNPCSVNNGGCPELCLYKGDNQANCQCAHGQPGLNGTQAVCHSYMKFIAYSKVTGIDTVHIASGGQPNKPMAPIEDKDHMKNVIGLTVDYKLSRFFFSDIQNGNIQYVNFNGTGYHTVVKTLGSAEGLAYDPHFQELYWTSYSDSSISRISVSQFRPNAAQQTVVQLNTDDHPRAIVIDSCVSKMYWTNWNDQQASIQTAYLSGWDIKSIITTDIKTPNGLAIDHSAKKLYWIDARLDKIERCDYDGNGRKVILSGAPKHGFSIAVYGNYLYWSDWVLRAVLRVNKYSGKELVYLQQNLPRQPMALAAVAPEAGQCQNHACAFQNGGCEQTCGLDEQGLVQCSCREGFVLQSDNATCGPVNVNCAHGQFLCAGGQCIDYELTCDGRPDCHNASDENLHYCRMRACPSGFYRCRNLRCINESRVCDKHDDCGDLSDELHCHCEPGWFQCGDGTCIKGQYMCDLDRDCPDAADEKGCNQTDCSGMVTSGATPGDWIKCTHTTACILPGWVCDGYDDCWDGSDEANCQMMATEAPCPEHWEQCEESKECVPRMWICDGDADCQDKWDEANCTYSCSADQLLCDSAQCIPNKYRCDGMYDCDDKTDEEKCGHQKCVEKEFQCNVTGQCIPQSWVCDGEKDCVDGHDESLNAGCRPVPCDYGEFQCRNFRCVLESFLCDGDDDCGDGSDEPSYCVYKNCTADEFRCAHLHQCIPLKWKCDGGFDCNDHSDEAADTCVQSVCQKSDQFQCRSGACVASAQRCDGKRDCLDSSDELHCGRCKDQTGDVCGPNMQCTDQTVGYECTCKAGFTKTNNGSAYCNDLNECEEFLPCTHFCYNTFGSFKCACADGYALASDKRTCKYTVDQQPVILVSNRYYIRSVTLSGQKVELVASQLQNAVALDYDWKEQMIYWSDVTSSGSTIRRRNISDSTATPQSIHNTTLRNPDGLAVDWLGRNLYWCDKTTDTIEVSKLTGLYRKVLVRVGLQEPRALAVNPFRGWLFYSDWGESPHIGRLGMDGSQPTRIVDKHLGWPNALTIDYITEHIFWADARLDYIARADLYGNNVQRVLDSDLPHVFAITVFEDSLYWTDWETKSIERAHKFSGLNRTRLVHMIHRPMDIQIYSQLKQMSQLKRTQVNPCENNGGCLDGTLCLIKSGGVNRVCACPERHYLSTDKKSCIANCTSSEFLCVNSFKCIPFWWQCDGQNDCGDNADEPSTCGPYHCSQPGLFQCHGATGQFDCISPTQICDGTPQCSDGSDESDCLAHTCMESQFKCVDPPKCIPLSQHCNGFFDCADHSDEKHCHVPSCATNQFRCTNKRCIPYVWKCDNDNDCGDDSDEQDDCLTAKCREGYLKCNSSGRCVPQSWSCDGDNDCGENDSSDEPPDKCGAATCEPTYFKCKNNRCIPGRWKCDYEDDCRDGSDERNCTARNCSESEFRCSNGRCIAKLLRCDGHSQCLDGSDEANCVSQCSLPADTTPFPCSDSRYCIPRGWVCDEDLDCIDGSDEHDCPAVAVCDQSQEFQCSGGQCIPFSWLCDGRSDCADGADEDRLLCSNYTCQPGYVRCEAAADTRTTCVAAGQVCSMAHMCSNLADQAQCSRSCAADMFQCSQTGQCIDNSYVCDKYPDCVDGTDEGAVCGHVCDSNVNCTHKELCKNEICRCRPGYKYNTTSGNCIDVNECALVGYCPQRCINKQTFTWTRAGPGYHCYCDDGYQMDNENNSINAHLRCKAKGKSEYLLLGIENELHVFSMHSAVRYQQQYTSPQSNEATQLRVDSVAVHMDQWTAYITNHHAGGGIYSYTLSKSLAQNQTAPRHRRSATQDVHLLQQIQFGEVEMVSPRGIAVDWVAGHLYWADDHKGTIESSNLNGTAHRVVIDEDLEKPTAVAVNPETHQLFWAVEGSRARIECSYLDGSGRRVVASEGVMWPGGLAVDYANQRLYWTDIKLGTISTVAINGADRETVWTPSAHSNLTDPYKIEVFENDLYVSTYTSHSLYRLPKSGVVDPHSGAGRPSVVPERLLHQLNRMGGHAVVQENTQKRFNNDTAVNPCWGQTCPANSMCVNLPLASGATCVCVHGFTYNNRTCTKQTPATCSSGGICKNGASCPKNEHQDVKCSCPMGYQGTRCEISQCYSKCLNGGSCLVSAPGRVSCLCPATHTGLRCQVDRCSHFCRNGGLCKVDQVMGPRCHCPRGYKGRQCEQETLHDCEDYDCSGNNGRCHPDPNFEDRPQCICKEGFAGEHCEKCKQQCNSTFCSDYTCENGYCSHRNLTTPTPYCECRLGYKRIVECARPKSGDDCQDRCVAQCDGHCDNKGTCAVDPDGNPVCHCSPEFYGTRCESSRCSELCYYPGTTDCSIQGPYNASCVCKRGYYGPKCNQTQPCIANTCLNGGTCIKDSEGLHICLCQDGFHGFTCNKTERCIMACANGGNCTGAGYKSSCSCPAGFEGSRCQHRVKGAATPFNKAAIVVPVVVCILVILVVVIALIVYRKPINQFRHKRLKDNGNVHFSNPLYQGDEDDTDALTFEADKPTNFSNPMYDELYNERQSSLEKKSLLKETHPPALEQPAPDDPTGKTFADDDEQNPLKNSFT